MDRTRDFSGGLVWHPSEREDPVPPAEIIWHSLGALVVGLILGIVMVMRYDQICGLSTSACTVIRSVVLTATWTGASWIYPIKHE